MSFESVLGREPPPGLPHAHSRQMSDSAIDRPLLATERNRERWFEGRSRISSVARSMRCTRQMCSRARIRRHPTATWVNRRHRRVPLKTTLLASPRRRRGRRARRPHTKMWRCACLSIRTRSRFSRGVVPFAEPPSRHAENKNGCEC